jgi:hypothetical protein
MGVMKCPNCGGKMNTSVKVCPLIDDNYFSRSTSMRIPGS